MSRRGMLVFARGSEIFERARDDSNTVTSTQNVALRRLGSALPSGMRAHYTVFQGEYRDDIEVRGYKQARSINGRRYFFHSGPGAIERADLEVISWAERVLREREKEAS